MNPPDPVANEFPICGQNGVICPDVALVPVWAYQDPSSGWQTRRYGLAITETGNYADYLINWADKTLGFIFFSVLLALCVVFLMKVLGGMFR